MSHTITTYLRTGLYPLTKTKIPVPCTGRPLLSRTRDGLFCPVHGTSRSRHMTLRYQYVNHALQWYDVHTPAVRVDNLGCRFFFGIHSLGGGELFADVRRAVVSILTGRNCPHRPANGMSTGPSGWSPLYTAGTPRCVDATGTCECVGAWQQCLPQ